MAIYGAMARTTKTAAPKAGENPGRVIDIDVSQELSESFLEYAYSVIYSRALPDARDGLKLVQRRILHQMNEMGLRPDKGHVKCARAVGEVMGKLHPHGDGAALRPLELLGLTAIHLHGGVAAAGGPQIPLADAVSGR